MVQMAFSGLTQWYQGLFKQYPCFQTLLKLTSLSSSSNRAASSAKICTEESSFIVTEPLLTENKTKSHWDEKYGGFISQIQNSMVPMGLSAHSK